MDKDRRGFITATVAAAASQLAGIGEGAEQGMRDGRKATTKQEQLDISRSRNNGHYTCVRTLESNDGPFYYESSLRRGNITEGRKGVPLRLRIQVANALIPGNSCSPLPGAVVDVWQADADGMYSNVGGDIQNEATLGQTFMRGHQLTDANGFVEFETVMPGWELVSVPPPANAVLRATHIHVKVFQDYKIAATQLYFPDEYLDELYNTVEPYRRHQRMTAPGASGDFGRIRNTQDTAFLADRSKPMEIKRHDDGIFAEATIGIVTLGAKGVAPLFR